MRAFISDDAVSLDVLFVFSLLLYRFLGARPFVCAHVRPFVTKSARRLMAETLVAKLSLLARVKG